MATTAVIFLTVAITTALIGVYSPPDQGLPDIMYWFTGVSLVLAVGFVFAHIALRLSAR